MFYSEDEIIVNADDIASAFWRELYAIRLETGTAWLTDAFIVNADSLQEALDTIADYCIEHGLRGYYLDASEVYADCDHGPDYADCDCDDGYMSAGNTGVYLYDTGSVRVELLATRDWRDSWQWRVSPVCETVQLAA